MWHLLLRAQGPVPRGDLAVGGGLHAARCDDLETEYGHGNSPHHLPKKTTGRFPR